MNTRKIHNYFLKGLYGRRWYYNTRVHTEKIFGLDTDLFIDLLAATSPNTNVKANVSKALTAYRQFKNNEKFSGQLPICLNMLDIVRSNYFTGQSKPFGGPKVQAFAKALKGDFSQVVVDTWMLRAFDIPNATPLQVRKITCFIKKKAVRFEMTPAEVQAAIWCGVKLSSQRKQDHNTEPFETFLPFEI